MEGSLLEKLQQQLQHKRQDFAYAIKSGEGFATAKALLVEIRELETQIKTLQNYLSL